MRLIVLAAPLLVGCLAANQDGASASQRPADGVFGPARITGVTVVRRAGAKVDSLPAPAALIAAYRDSIDVGIWDHMAFRLRGDSFSADVRYYESDHARDTVVAGRLGRPDSGFINLDPASPCEVIVNGHGRSNFCLTAEGGIPVSRACLDLIFADSAFALADVRPESFPYWHHLRGVPCAQATPPDPNLIRTEFRIEFPRR